MSSKKANHNHKEELKCVLGLLLKRYHKTYKLAHKYDTQRALYQSRSNKHQNIQRWNQTWI